MIYCDHCDFSTIYTASYNKKAHEFSFTSIKIIENKNYALKIDNKKTTLNKGTQCPCSSHNKQCSLDSSTHNVYEYH